MFQAHRLLLGVVAIVTSAFVGTHGAPHTQRSSPELRILASSIGGGYRFECWRDPNTGVSTITVRDADKAKAVYSLREESSAVYAIPILLGPKFEQAFMMTTMGASGRYYRLRVIKLSGVTSKVVLDSTAEVPGSRNPLPNIVSSNQNIEVSVQDGSHATLRFVWSPKKDRFVRIVSDTERKRT